MPEGSLCEADQELPDGNANFEINNCNDDGGDGNYDVFVCVKGGTKAKYKFYIYPKIIKRTFLTYLYGVIYFTLYEQLKDPNHQLPRLWPLQSQ